MRPHVGGLALPRVRTPKFGPGKVPHASLMHSRGRGLGSTGAPGSPPPPPHRPENDRDRPLPSHCLLLAEPGRNPGGRANPGTPAVQAACQATLSPPHLAAFLSVDPVPRRPWLPLGSRHGRLLRPLPSGRRPLRELAAPPRRLWAPATLREQPPVRFHTPAAGVTPAWINSVSVCVRGPLTPAHLAGRCAHASGQHKLRPAPRTRLLPETHLVAQHTGCLSVQQLSRGFSVCQPCFSEACLRRGARPRCHGTPASPRPVRSRVAPVCP